MARKSATPTFNITWNNKDIQEGATLEGYYIGKAIVTGQYGQKTKYTIETKDGTLYDVFSTTTLERQFNNVPEGVYVWVTFQGETKSKNGRNVKLYSVEFDDEIAK